MFSFNQIGGRADGKAENLFNRSRQYVFRKAVFMERNSTALRFAEEPSLWWIPTERFLRNDEAARMAIDATGAGTKLEGSCD
jgi:hypothetical protein